eukprot:6505744-Prymnesium_polylepis.1
MLEACGAAKRLGTGSVVWRAIATDDCSQDIQLTERCARATLRRRIVVGSLDRLAEEANGEARRARAGGE